MGLFREGLIEGVKFQSRWEKEGNVTLPRQNLGMTAVC